MLKRAEVILCCRGVSTPGRARQRLGYLSPIEWLRLRIQQKSTTVEGAADDRAAPLAPPRSANRSGLDA